MPEQRGPRVSVIIPFYNAASTLGRCLDSVLGQTLADIEALCYDDGSTDASRAIAEARGDGRIRIFCGPNRGAAYARNFCMREARGDYIAFMDSDDEYYSPQSLALLYEAAQSSGAVITSGSVSSTFEGIHQYFGRQCDLKKGYIDIHEYQYNYGYWCALYKKSFLLGSKISFPDLSRYQDVPFYLDAQLSAGKIYFIPEFVYRYNVAWRNNYYNERRLRDILLGAKENIRKELNSGLSRLASLEIGRILLHSDGIADCCLRGNEEIKAILWEIDSLFSNKDCHLPILYRILTADAILQGKFSELPMLEDKAAQAEIRWMNAACVHDPTFLALRHPEIDSVYALEPEKALFMARKLVENFPLSPNPLLHLSWLLERKGDFAKARECAEKAYRTFPEYLVCIERLFYINLYSNQPEEARKLLEEARACPGKFGSMPDRMEATHAFHNGQKCSALELLEKSLLEHADDIWLRLWHYDMLLQTGQKERACSSLAKALGQHPLEEKFLDRFLRLPPDELLASPQLLALGHCPASARYLYSHFHKPAATMKLARSFGTPAKFMLNLFADKLGRMPAFIGKRLNAVRLCRHHRL